MDDSPDVVVRSALAVEENVTDCYNQNNMQKRIQLGEHHGRTRN